jgi:NIL domain
MTDLSWNKSQAKVLQSIDINIPQQLHQEPILAKLITNYHLIVNFHAAILDRKATGGGWFNLSVEGRSQDIEQALKDLQELGVKIFSHSLVSIDMGTTLDREDTFLAINPK